jgi:hypothetical protein
MSIPFSRSTRALDSDSFRPSLFGVMVACIVLIAWGAWFVFARMTVQITSSTLTLDRDGAIIATFAPEQLAQIRAGQDATITINATSNAPDASRVVRAQVAQVANRSANRMEPNTVRFFVLENTPIALARQANIVVEEVSPLMFVLRTGQALARTGRGN